MTPRQVPSSSTSARVALAVLLLAASVLGFACGTQDDRREAGLTVRDAWARSTAGNPGENTAIYLVIENEGSADRLIGASATGIANSIELHETREEGGRMRMQPVEGWATTSEEALALEPGGKHLMVLGVSKQLAQGDTFEVTLTFERAGAVVAPVQVRDAPPTSMTMPVH
jgi:copper(I)-binding protein